MQRPRFARFVFNTYHGYAPLVVQTKHNAKFIYSKEGVAQGDPLSMLMYAAALMPLIQSLSTPACNQNWYADDYLQDSNKEAVVLVAFLTRVSS